MEKHRSIEFVIPRDKSTLLKEKIERVCFLFGVEVSLTKDLPSSENQWVCINGSSEELRGKAKSYITSLCSKDSVRHCIDLKIPVRLFDDLKNGTAGEEVERLAGAVLSFGDSELYVQGGDFAVAVAKSDIEQRIAVFTNDSELNTCFSKCADSDDLVHDSAENIPERSAVASSASTDIAVSMREFAHKLNYTDKEIDAVIRTFGIEININQLLQELVKNSASALQLSSASEDTSMLPVARGSSTPRDRVLTARGAIPANSNRVAANVEADNKVPFQADLLRPIVIDGSNVAMSHGNQQVFSCRGIKLCVEFFKRRGHTDITVFVPLWRKHEARPESPIAEREILDELYRQNFLKFTPSRKSGNRLIVCYDDKFTVDLADQNGGIIVSNDGFRDLIKENPRWRETIEQRTLMYTFAGDLFMPPDDPLGRKGPSLDDFLKKGSATHPRICPYLKNCTFGNRCKYYHPERDTQRQQEKGAVRNPPENPELPTASPPVTTSPTCQSTRTSTNGIHPRVGDPRVSILTPDVQRCFQSTASSANETHNRNRVGDLRASVPSFQSCVERRRVPDDVVAVGDPRVSVPSFQSCFERRRAPDDVVAVGDPRVSVPSFQSCVERRRLPNDVVARGSRQVSASSYDYPCVRSGEEYYPRYPNYHDYHNTVPSDYTARNIPYQDQTPLYHHDVSQYSPLPPAQWPPSYHPQFPYPSPSDIGYPAGAYMHRYFEPAPVAYRNFQGGQGLHRDQIDSGKSGDSSAKIEHFGSLVEKLKNVFKDMDEDVIIRFLRSHPKECADEDIDKLADKLASLTFK